MKQLLIVLVAISVLLPVSMEAHGDCNRASTYLGISSHDISKEKARKLGFNTPYGTYVSKVCKNSAAEKAGLQVFDYIYAIGDKEVERDQNLNAILSDYETGDEVELRFIRNGQAQRKMVRLGDKSDYQNNKTCSEKPFLGINQNNRGYRGPNRGISVDIVSNSTAEAMGLEDDDVITSINNHPMIDWNDITIAINDLAIGENIVVEYIRDGQTNRASMPIQSYNKTKSHNDNTYANSGGGHYDNETYEEEEDNREYGFLGVYSDQVSKEKARKLGFDNPYGSYVTGIISGTAAEKAGVQPFDYIYGVDQYRTGENQNLTHIFRKYEPNEQATLQLVRDKRKETLAVTFGSREDVHYKEKSKCEEPFFGIRHDHSRSINVDGVAVEIVRNSTAKSIGLEDGDIITQINGHYMVDWKDIGIAIDNMTVGHAISVAFLRNGARMTQQGAIQSYCDTKPEYKKHEQGWNKHDKDKQKDKDKDNDYDNDDNDNDFFNNDLVITKNVYSNSKDLDMSNIMVRISDVNSGEARNLQQRYGHQMGSNLEVDNFKLSKNTEKNLFDLTFDLPNRGETVVKIINEDGRVIYEYDLGQFSGDFADKVDISQNGAGAYYLSIQSGVKTKTKKIELKKR